LIERGSRKGLFRDFSLITTAWKRLCHRLSK
jgi:hypothetical protein